MMPPFPSSLADLVAGAVAEPVLEGEAGAIVLRLQSADESFRFLKYGTGSVANDIVDEAVRLRWLSGRLPCAEALHFVVSGDAAWLLTSGVDGKTGDAWLAADPGNLD